MSGCEATIRRKVPERERMTMDADDAHPAQERAARHAGGRDEGVVALHELVGGQHA